MKIEKTYKLTIKDHIHELNESEMTALYESCRRSLNISYVGSIPDPNPFDNPSAPSYPSWPTYPWGTPLPNIYPTTTHCDTTSKINFI
jgi:hypothetical protein